MGDTDATDLSSLPMTARKRKISTNDHITGRVVKHRSSQACQSCRTRKVRCDVVKNGSPCTNCRLDQIECVVLASRRGKSHHANSNDLSQSADDPHRRSSKVTNESSPDISRTPDWSGHEKTTHIHASPTRTSHVPVVVTFEEENDEQRDEQQASERDAVVNDIDVASAEAYVGLLTPETGSNTFNQYRNSVEQVALPTFIAPLPGHVSKEDREFLAWKGAMTIPEHDLQMEILRAYLFSVHPFMPMLDYKAFIHAIFNDQADSHISLLLFQAVMFAGLHSLQLHVLHRFGFKSVKQARKVFIDRARLLYELDVESDNAAVLQSLILMSLWYGKADDRRHTWHWTGLAYDIARSMGLHREPTIRYTSDRIRHFRRRLWWSLYIRDRMIALGTRRPMRIQDDEFNVTMLKLEDFEIDQWEDSSQGKFLVPSLEEQTSTALMCIQLAELGRCIGRVVSSQYTVLSSQPDVPTTMMVVSKRDGGQIDELESCDKELNEWFQSLSSNVRRPESKVDHLDPHSCSEVHWAILNLTYLTVVNVLHRSRALQPLPDAAEAQSVQRQSRSKVKDSARGLTKVSQSMLCQDQVRFLGPIGVTALNAACLSHMLDISSGDEDVRDASTFRLHQSLQVLQSLRGIYAAADSSVSFLATITQKAGISIPAHLFTTTIEPVASPINSLPLQATGEFHANDNNLGGSGPYGKQFNGANIPYSLTESANGAMQPPNSLANDGQNRSARVIATQPDFGASPVSPSSVAFPASKPTTFSTPVPTGMAQGPPFQGHSSTHQIDPGISADGTFSGWNNDESAGIGLESMAFSYDFYSNAFGFFDGDIQGL